MCKLPVLTYGYVYLIFHLDPQDGLEHHKIRIPIEKLDCKHVLYSIILRIEDKSPVWNRVTNVQICPYIKST